MSPAACSRRKAAWRFSDLTIQIKGGLGVQDRTLWATPSVDQLPCVYTNPKICHILQQAVMVCCVTSVLPRLAHQQK